MVARTLLLATIACLAACDGEADPRICSTPRGVSTSKIQKGLREQTKAEIAESCVHRWAYRLARAPGGNREITEAVMGACADAVSYLQAERFITWLKSTPDLSDAAAERQNDAVRREVWQGALFHVVQARAGHCDTP